jgi:hypothetical protein
LRGNYGARRKKKNKNAEQNRQAVDEIMIEEITDAELEAQQTKLKAEAKNLSVLDDILEEPKTKDSVLDDILEEPKTKDSVLDDILEEPKTKDSVLDDILEEPKTEAKDLSVLDDIFGQETTELKPSKPEPATKKLTKTIPKDVQEFAKKIKVSSLDLWIAMQQESLSSIAELREAVESMGQPLSFHDFVKNFVHSYLENKKEESLLGLVGVSANTGAQKLSTDYACLFSEIFKPEVGNFVLSNTKSENYNSFNVANLIQKHLMELDEITRVSYLKNLLALLKQKKQLLTKSKKNIDSVRKAPVCKLFPNQDKLCLFLEQYFADIALFKLTAIPHDQLPDTLEELLPKTIEECLPYMYGFPKNLVEQKSKILYMLQKLFENNPMLLCNP